VSAGSGSVADSDVFFSFRDGLDILADVGRARWSNPAARFATEVIATANERGVAMVLMGERHFRRW